MSFFLVRPRILSAVCACRFIPARIALTAVFYLTAVVATVSDIQNFGRSNGIDSIMQVLMGRGDTDEDNEDEWQADGLDGAQVSCGCS